MVSWCIRAPLALILWLGIAGAGLAQDGKLNLREDATSLSGKAFALDAAFSERTGKAIEDAFTVFAPTSQSAAYTTRVNEQASQGLVTFTFANDAGDLLDAVSLSTANSPPLPDTSVRLERLAAKMQMVVFPLIQAIDANAEAPRIRPISVAELEGVELYGDYTHPTHGLLRWRLVGLPQPQESFTVVALAQISLDRVALGSSDEMVLTPSGRLIESLRYRDGP